MAFSAGFHPHPKISYANAAATGTASEAEYVEISVVERVEPEALRLALDAALPEGLDVLQVVEADPGSLADRLQASRWVLRFDGLTAADLQPVIESFLATEQIEVTRILKNGPRTFDVRQAVLDMRAEDADAGYAILQMVVRHTTPVVRPDDVLTALRTHAAFEPPRSPLVTRLAQGPLLPHAAEIADPLVGNPTPPAPASE